MNSDCIGLISIESLPDFSTYLPQICNSTIFLSDCDTDEIRTIIKELEKLGESFSNGEPHADDITIVVLKKK